MPHLRMVVRSSLFSRADDDTLRYSPAATVDILLADLMAFYDEHRDCPTDMAGGMLR